MLVLSRKLGERILVQAPCGDIWIVITDVDNGRVKIGIDCDRSIPIYRSELLDRIEKKPPEGGE